MPGYRGPDWKRVVFQQDSFQYANASCTVSWVRPVSASGSVDVAGIGATSYSATLTISALLRPIPTFAENITPAGMMAAGRFEIITHEQLGREDRIIWSGASFKVDSVAVRSTMTSGWISQLVREEI